MAKRSTIKVQGINFRTYPHSEEGYRNLINILTASKLGFRVRGDTFLSLSHVTDEIETTRGPAVRGVLNKFTKIDIEGDWFDQSRNEKARPSDIPDLPDHLQPNFKPFYFLYYLKSHTFVFEHYGTYGSLSIKMVNKFLQELVSSLRADLPFDTINLDQITDYREIDEIFDIETLKHIQMIIRRPNVDFTDDVEADFEERLVNQNASSQEVSLRAVPGQSLEPDAQTQTYARIAARNGKVVASGRGPDGVSETRSSDDYPLTPGVKYDRDQTSPVQGFIRAASKFMGLI